MARVIVLDLDDTLYLEREYQLSGFEAAGRHLEETRSVGALAVLASRLFEEGVRQRVYDEALERLGIRDAALVQELVEVHRSHRPIISLLPDARRFLARARALGLGLALLSDGFLVTQRRKVAALGLEGVLDPVVLTDAWGRDKWKPSEHGFREIMSARGGGPDEYVYLADNPAKDFLAPNRLGWRTIRIRRPHGEHFHAEPGRGLFAAGTEVASLDEVELGGVERNARAGKIGADPR